MKNALTAREWYVAIFFLTANRRRMLGLLGHKLIGYGFTSQAQ